LTEKVEKFIKGLGMNVDTVEIVAENTDGSPSRDDSGESENMEDKE